MTGGSVSLDDGTPTSVSLLQRALRRDALAWERVVALYGPIIYGWCRKWGLQPRDAENVGQEVFLRLSVRLDHFRRDRPDDSFRGWLHTIARNCYVDFIRREQRQVSAAGGSDAQLQLGQ